MKQLQVTVLCAVVCIVSLLVVLQKRSNRTAGAVDKLQQFCIGAADAMRQDEAAFLGSDAAARERAYERFYEGDAMYHSAQSLLYCVDTLPDMPASCQLNKDWSCLARIAHQIRQSLQGR